MNWTIRGFSVPAIVSLCLLHAGAGHAQSMASSLPPQLQTDGQRMGGAGLAQTQTDNERRASRETAMAAASGADTQDGMGRFGAMGPRDGMSGAGPASIGASVAADAVNAAAGVANRAILRGGGRRSLYVDPDGIIRNDKPRGNGDDGANR